MANFTPDRFIRGIRKATDRIFGGIKTGGAGRTDLTADGHLAAESYTAEQYHQILSDYAFISKGTLENVIRDPFKVKGVLHETDTNGISVDLTNCHDIIFVCEDYDSSAARYLRFSVGGIVYSIVSLSSNWKHFKFVYMELDGMTPVSGTANTSTSSTTLNTRADISGFVDTIHIKDITNVSFSTFDGLNKATVTILAR